jgi:ABC-type transport system involved in multi-copper enzyme maturation permease subunit
MTKLWVIAWKELITRFTDRNLLLIMLAAPLAISSIIGLAFGNLGRGGSPIRGIPVAVVNHDRPSQYGVAFGAVLSDMLTEGAIPSDSVPKAATCPQPTPAPENTLAGGMTVNELINGTVFDADAAQRLIDSGTIPAVSSGAAASDAVDQSARAAVDKGVFTAAVIIPAGFSSSLTDMTNPTRIAPAANVIVYGNQGNGLSAGIVRSVVEGIVSQMVSGDIAIGATLSQLAERHPDVLRSAVGQDLGTLFACAFMPSGDLVGLVDEPVQAAQNTVTGTLLVTFGSAQAMFFALFTGQFGILSMYEERKNWTLQRMLTSPTPRWSILGGKLVGVLASVLFQLVALIVALTAVGSLIEGRLTLIWGSNWIALGLTVLAAGVAVSGLGMLLAGVLKGIEQANVVGSVLNIALGVLGGGFGFQLPRSVSAFSIIYWGRDAFDQLATGHGDVALNLLMLFGQGVLMFGIGLFLFNRKFEA